MKKLLVLAFSMFLSTLTISFAEEETPVLPQNNGVSINSDGTIDLINVDNMKRKNIILRAKDRIRARKSSPVEVDIRMMEQQRALDIMTNPNKNFVSPIL